MSQLQAAYRTIPAPIRSIGKRYLFSSKLAWHIRFLTQSAPPPLQDPHALPLHAKDTPQRIAAMMEGPAARAVRSGDIGRGTENHGIIIYRIEGPRLPRREILEKITSQQPEAMLSQCIQQAGTHFAAHDLVPEIYGVTRSQRHYHIFMERLQGLGSSSDVHDDPELADALAAAILRFSRAVQDLMDDKKYAFPLQNAAERGGRDALRSLVATCGDASLGAILSKVEDELARSELIMCHNDLHWSNISLERDDCEPSLRFIDFNLVGPNIPGSELHFFARQAWRNPNAVFFFNRLSATYASQSDIPGHLLKAAAYLKAAQRLSAGKFVKENQKKISAVSLLLKAQRELSSPE